MTGLTFLKYLFLGYSFLISLITFSLSDDLRNPRFFHRCFIAGIISSIIGIILELTNVLKMLPGMTILLMSISIIYLGFYRILFKLFKSWKGVDPYITSSSSTIGGKTISGFWSKYPKDRKIMWSDFLFSLAQVFIPIFVIIALIIIIIELNKYL